MLFHEAPHAFFTGIALLFAVSTAFASYPARGSQGHEVQVLQQALQNAGYKIKKADGVFGEDTERAVAEFQRDNKIKITGVSTMQRGRSAQEPHQTTWGIDVPPPAKKRSVACTPNGNPILPANKVSDVIQTAKSYMGTPYVFGGTTPKGFRSCSGYLQYVFRSMASLSRARRMSNTSSGFARKARRNLLPGRSRLFRNV